MNNILLLDIKDTELIQLVFPLKLFFPEEKKEELKKKYSEFIKESSFEHWWEKGLHGVKTKDGKVVEVEYYYSDIDENIKQVANALREYSSKIGMDINVEEIMLSNINIKLIVNLLPKEEDIKQIQHMYLELLNKLFGDWLMEQFEEYYGSRSTLYFNALTYFDNMYENDAIKEHAINKQMQQE